MRKFTVILISVLLVLSLTACGNNQQAKDTAPGPSLESAGETSSKPEETMQPTETLSGSQAESEEDNSNGKPNEAECITSQQGLIRCMRIINEECNRQMDRNLRKT